MGENEGVADTDGFMGTDVKVLNTTYFFRKKKTEWMTSENLEPHLTSPE